MKEDEVQEEKKSLDYRTNSVQEINLRHIRMITSEIGLHSFLTYIQLNLSSQSSVHEDHVRIIKQSINSDNDFNVFLIYPNLIIIKRFLQKLHRCIWAFCSNIDLRGGPLHFIRGMNMQFTAITMRMHFFTF